MISLHDFYVVLTAMVPLYVAMILAYGSVRWWKIFTADQCSGINRFVAVFAVPLLSFHFISRCNVYEMNFRFIAADSLQKVIMLFVLCLWANLTKNGSLEWSITIFSLSTLPNTLVMGIPLLIAMYGDYSGSLMVQVVVLQCIVWYTLLLFLFEYRGAKMLIMEQFPETAGSIVSFKVESDVVSLDGQDFLETDAEIGNDGKLHVTVRRSFGADIYSLSSSKNPTPRGSNFNHTERLSNFGNSDTGRMSNFSVVDLYSVHSSRPSNFNENSAQMTSSKFSYPAPNSEIVTALQKTATKSHNQGGGKANHYANELHMFVWNSSASSMSKVGFRGPDFGASDQSHPGAKEISLLVSNNTQNGKAKVVPQSNHNGEEKELKEDTAMLTKQGPNSTAELEQKLADRDAAAVKHMPPASVMTRLILIMVWRKLTRNPNTYSSLIGLIWSLVSFKWDLHMPKIIDESIKILSDAGLGMAMFSLGLFMGLQPKIIACGKLFATLGMGVRFLIGPAVMAVASIVVGLRGTLLRIAILQAVLPQGIVPFVFAKEYNVHPQILSTAVIFGMLIALPITLVYYIILDLNFFSGLIN